MTWRGGGHPDELISASLSGDLTDAERAELDGHLARCETCRGTLAAFKAERRILSGLPAAGPPRDLSGRVRGGIEAGRFAGPWWRRSGSVVPLLASAATFAAVVLGVVFFGKLQLGPVGQASASPQSSPSAVSSANPTGSTAPSTGPTAPPLFLGSGELGYLSLNGGSLQPSHLTFVNDATGASIDAGIVSGPPIAASLSPDGMWLAYITQKGETGANEVWAIHLTDGEVVPLGCSMAGPFTEQLAWSANGPWLAYTLTSVDLGSNAGCPSNDGKPGTTSPWVFDSSRIQPLSRVYFAPGDGYFTSFYPVSEGLLLMTSQPGIAPSVVVHCWFCDGPASQTIGGVFGPVISPNGIRAMFWKGTMASSGSGWQFSRGGIPQLSSDLRSTGPASPWVGTPLFSDLTPVRGEAFAFGSFVWGPDSDLIAFWNGTWTGAPQSAEGSYPSQRDVYVGRVSGGPLSSASRLPLTLDPNAWIVDVKFAADGSSVAVTIGLPSAGVGDPPSAYLQIVPLSGGATRNVGGGVNPPPWDGPAVFGR